MRRQQFNDSRRKKSGEETLRRMFGRKWKLRVQRALWVSQWMPAVHQERLWGARTEDGSLVGNDPHFIAWLSEIAVFVPPHVSVIDRQIEEIEDLMRVDRKRYLKDKKQQQRLRALYLARDEARQRARCRK